MLAFLLGIAYPEAGLNGVGRRMREGCDEGRVI
jgi:hypothetical protein